ncbi:hypothetical protein HYS28_01610 [Candidatus Uhrbacteria bacterium]|nr:hypothetical protein [Candidatus Uhrbacteria bacterium]
MKRLFATLAIFGVTFAPIAPALAFNPDYIISDDELTNPFSLDRNQIQAYLERGYLGDYKTEDYAGVTRYAADIIWRAAQMHGVSPRFLLVLLQKEQSLVEDDEPTQKQLDWAAGYAVCDDCSMDDPAIQRWKGFGKQVNSAAMQFSEGYLADIESDGITQGKYGPDIPVTIDGTTVVPENAATAALYAYTPHLHGNENFAAIWDRWFGAEYPTGSLLQAVGEPGVYLIEYGYRRPITSRSALLSRFNEDLIIPVSKTTLDNYADGAPISFPNYSLLRDEDGSIFLLVDDSLRHIESMEAFRAVGFSEDEIVDITNEDRETYGEGEPITTATVAPTGTLYQLSTNGTRYFIQDGTRHVITDPAIADARFPGQTPTSVAPVVIEQFREGDALLLPDGYLVKGSTPVVYVITDGMRRAIASEQVFLAYGWSWDDIVTIDDGTLALHPLGADIAE